MSTGNVQFKVETGLLVNGNSNVAGDFQISGNLIVGGTTVSTGNAVGDFLPSPSNTYSLGSASQRWAGVYAQNVDISTALLLPTGSMANSSVILANVAVRTPANNTPLGNSTGRWDFFANNANLVTLGVSGLSNLASVTVSSTLGVTGLATLATANITGQFDARAAANVATTLGVVGATTLSNTLAVSGAVTVTSNTTLNANSTVTAFQMLGNNTTANITIAVNAIAITGNALFANIVSITGAANALSTLGVSGATTLANVSVGAGALAVNTTQVTVLNAALSVNTGSKLSIVASGNSTYGNLALVNDVTTVQGNVSFRSGALFVDATNNRVGVQNTSPDAPLTVTGAANISGAVVIGGNLLVQGSFTNSAAVDHNTTTNFVANKHIDHTSVSISPGSGLTGGGDISATRTLTVNPNNGISTNASGVFTVGSNGIIVTATGINVNANTGVTVNTSGVFATAASPGAPITAVQFNDNSTFGGNSSFVYDKSTNTLSLSNSANITVSAIVGNATVNVVITSTQMKLMNSTSNNVLTVPTVAQYANGNFFHNANGSWTFPVAGAGLISNGTGIYVNANTGITANSSGVFGSGGAGTPSGANTTIQFNDSAAFGGNDAFTFNKATTVVSVGNTTQNTTITLGSLKIANATSNNTLLLPTAAQFTNGTFTHNANGSWTSSAGKQAMFVPAGAMQPRSASGATALAVINGAANQPDIEHMAYSGNVVNFARFSVIMPKSWDLGTITARFAYRRASGTGAANTVWGIRAVAVANNATPVTAFGANATLIHVASTTTAAFDLTGETAACTIAGSPSAENMVFMEVFRDGAAATDTLDNVDAQLSGVTIYYTTSALTDA